MKSIISATALAIALLGASNAQARVSFYAEAGTGYYEESLAHDEEARIYERPIGGVANHYWYDYRINIVEAQKELNSDLRRANDDGDARDAWAEYARELRNERARYANAMSRRGFLGVQVLVGD